jgi:hypothetical protein
MGAWRDAKERVLTSRVPVEAIVSITDINILGVRSARKLISGSVSGHQR